MHFASAATHKHALGLLDQAEAREAAAEELRATKAALDDAERKGSAAEEQIRAEMVSAVLFACLSIFDCF